MLVLLTKQKPKINQISYAEYAYRFVWRLEKLYSRSYYYIRHTYIHISVYIHYLEMDDIVKNVTLIWALNKLQITKTSFFIVYTCLKLIRKLSTCFIYFFFGFTLLSCTGLQFRKTIHTSTSNLSIAWVYIKERMTVERGGGKPS